MRKANSLGGRLIALALSIIMMLGMFPAGVIAVDDSAAYGVVEGLTDGVKINEIGKDIKVTFAGDLNWIAKNDDVGRTSDGWWIGLKVTAPETISIDTAKYTSGGQEKLFKDYNDSEDDAEVQFIQLWSLVKEEYLRSANLTDGLSTYTWSFDWDGNGEYEQTMTLDIDADQTILYKDGSTQVYPAESLGYGKLDMLTSGATVNDTDSANISVSYDSEITVAWSPKDMSVGRYQDGWWAGMKITVPTGMTEEQVKNAQYMSGENLRSFWTYKDSKEGDAVHYMTMWVPLNNLLTNSMEPFTYKFDWNNDGIFEQSVVMSVDASKVTLTKDGVQAYPVLGEVSSFSGGNTEGNYTGNTTVTIENAELTWFEADEEAGRMQDGWWVGVKVTAPVDTDLTQVQYRRKTGTDSTTGEATWTDGMEYKPDEGTSLQLWGLITKAYLESFEQQGRNLNYVWQFDWDGDDSFEQTVTITVVPSGITLKQAGFDFVQKTDTVTYAKDLQYPIVAPQGGQSTEDPVYTVNDPRIATLNEDGKSLTIHKAGTVTITATLGGTYYEAATASYELNVSVAKQDGSFAQDVNTKLPYSESSVYDLPAITGYQVEDPDIQYEITSVNGAAELTEDNKIKTNKPGLFVLKATIPGEADRYYEQILELEMEVIKAGQSFTAEDATIVYGVAAYTTEEMEEQLKVTSDGFGTGAYTFAVEENTIGAYVTDNGKRIAFEDSNDKTGTVKVTVTKAADDFYNESSTTFKLTVEFVETPDYEIVGASGNVVTPNANGWYNCDVYIKAVDSENWEISKTNERSTEDWTDKLPYDIESDGKEESPAPEFAFRRIADNSITDVTTVENYKMDKTVPVELAIGYDEGLTWLEALGKLFGFKKDTVSVTLKASDQLSGIDYIYYSTDSSEPVEDKNKIVFGGEESVEHTVELPAQYRNSVVFRAVDMAGKTSEYSDGNTLVVDQITPELEVEYEEDGTKEEDGILYANDALELILKFKADNTDLAKTFELYVNEAIQDGTKWETTADEHIQIYRIDLPVNGDYTITFRYEDYLGRMVEKTMNVRTDNTAPEFTVTYDPELKDNTTGKYFDDNRKATIVVKDHNFTAETMAAAVTMKDVTGNITISNALTEYLCEEANWKYMDADGNIIDASDDAVPDVRVAQYEFQDDAHYSFTLDCKDIIGNSAKQYVSEDFVVDHEDPTDLLIEYAEPMWQTILEGVTFGAYDAKLEVTIKANDAVSGIVKLYYNIGEGEKEIVIDPATGSASAKLPLIESHYRGKISMAAVDAAGRRSELTDGQTLVINEVTPDIDVEYAFTGEKTEDEAGRIYYTNDTVVATIKVKDPDFDLNAGSDENVEHKITNDAVTWPVVTVNGTVVENLTWTQNGEYWTAPYEMTCEDGKVADYELAITYTDFTNHAADPYTKEIRIDKEIPEFTVTYDPELKDNATGKYFDDNRKATIVVKDHNFTAETMAAAVTMKDVTGVELEEAQDAVSQDMTEKMQDASNWNPLGDDTYEFVYTFEQDAHYSFTLDCKDIIGNSAKQYVSEDFVIDHADPEDVKFTFSEPTWWGKLLERVFGFYNAPVTVTMSAEDDTAGVKEFVLSYVKEDGTSDLNAESETKTIDAVQVGNTNTFEASITLPAENGNLRGQITVKAVDYATNEKAAEQQNADKTETTLHTVVVDNEDPVISVSYETEATGIQYVNADMTTVEEGQETAATQVFFNNAVTAVITLNEANFFEGKNGETAEKVIHEVGILLQITDDSGKTTWVEYLPKGADQKYADVTKETKEITWSSEGDKHTIEIPYSENADYVLTVEYADHATNMLQKTEETEGGIADGVYTSKIITVDKLAPQITVTYGNKDVVRTMDGVAYYAAKQTATVRVVEHNFRAADMQAAVTAKDLLGADIAVQDYTKTMATQGSWKKVAENTYELDLEYPVEANYTFDYTFEDLAKNAAADYAQNAFTVDMTKPKAVDIAYSTHVFQNVLQDLTFGFYNAKMTVTISATDDISGVNGFVYSYLKAQNVSSVNAELINEALSNAVITQIPGTKTFTASFDIPKLALGNDNQFNGTVEFVAIDRSENVSDKREDPNKIIVVDNIAPTATISYNSPVQELGGVSYYAGSINATIVINEANFYSEDVVVTVNDSPVAVNWTNNNVDVHTGTFTISEDGDYVVKVSYTDRSTNAMTPYTSNQLTIDTQAPVIQVSDVKHQSANNAETISFTVQVTDRNIALENFKPVLSALVKKDNGSNQYTFETVEIALGEAKTSVNNNGDTVYTYTVENLEIDGYYSLVCEAVDHADHKVTAISSTDKDNTTAEAETVNFSVNREGSVFWITTEHTEGEEVILDQLNGKYVNGEVIVRLHEVNVDKVDDGKATIFTLNDGSSATDITLDDTNYQKNVSIGAGGWYQTDYTLDNSYFANDGVYSINIVTYDTAENSNVNSKSETGTISFTVDRTKPVVSANLTSGQIIDANEYKVYLQITELNLDASTVVVKYNGEVIEVEDLGNGEYSFVAKERNSAQTMEVVATDLAGNEAETYVVDPFTVSTNILVLFYANKLLFWGIMGGIVLLAAGAIWFFLIRKKKKEER